MDSTLPATPSATLAASATLPEAARADAGAGATADLADRWTLTSGRIVLSGTQAIGRILLDQAWLDRRNGLSTAGYISGYRGSPVGQVDSMLWSIAARLESANIVFQPGLNEDLAATAMRGSQQLDSLPGPRYQGVFAAWYGKGPGVDRACDAIKHGNYVGAHAKGGVVLFYGDDHGAKSSTVAHHSEQAMVACNVPSLYPATVGEIWSFGLMAYALSRYSGSWIGMKCVTDVIEQTASVDVDLPGFAPVLPPLSPERQAMFGLHASRSPFNPMGEERIVVEERLPLVHAFLRANPIDRVVFRADRPRIALITAGKTFGDVRAALAQLGLDDARSVALGLSLYKVGCIWPLEPERLRTFCAGHELVIVIEEKAPFLEPQVAQALINVDDRPCVIGKHDTRAQPLLSAVDLLDGGLIAEALRRVLAERDVVLPEVCSQPANSAAAVPGGYRRAPYFCSGCPHNRSTRLPDGSMSMAGIGCHGMVSFVRSNTTLLPTHMGGEGGNWLGLAPFTETPHIFQNMGDGTYYHSGLLAIRAAVAAGVNITYKILYNDAVAMTGGQPVDGPISVAEIAQQVRHEGVRRIAIVSDNPDLHRSSPGMPPDVSFSHRDDLDSVQRELREVRGCTVLIYEQTCAAEKRRRRKRGQMDDPPKRLFIATSVCEGCGDCSDVSTCVSLVPVETAFGRKRAIDQSSCNKDYSCLNGFCPSFITVHDAAPRRKARGTLDDSLWSGLPDAPVAAIGAQPYALMIAGIGGTGVVTVGAVIGMAAHLDGLAMATYDITGLSQKNGAVFSHVRIARQSEDIASTQVGPGEADTLLAFDLLAALAAECARTLSPGRTRGVANADVVPSLEFQFNRDRLADPARLLDQLRTRLNEDGNVEVHARTIAEGVMGDTIATNMFMVGIAAQSGMLPVSVRALEQAIRMNGVAVPFNLQAFRLGRLFAVDPTRVKALIGEDSATAALPVTLDEVLDHRAAHLTQYQDAALARRYRELVARVRDADAAPPGDERLALAVARNYARLLAYKDEYEVARLLSSSAFRAEYDAAFEPGGRIAFNLAPPLLSKPGPFGRPAKRVFSARILPLLRLLAKGKRLRGTRLDLFGHTQERRAERTLIADYEALVATVLTHLAPARREAAIALLGLADSVRGYGPVKEAAIARYRDDVAAALKAFLAAPDSGGKAGGPAAPAQRSAETAPTRVI